MLQNYSYDLNKSILLKYSTQRGLQNEVTPINTEFCLKTFQLSFIAMINNRTDL